MFNSNRLQVRQHINKNSQYRVQSQVLCFIPISAIRKVNIVPQHESNQKMSWYFLIKIFLSVKRYKGPTVWEAVNMFRLTKSTISSMEDSPTTIVQVSKSYKIGGVGTVVVGGVISGVLKEGDIVMVVPGNLRDERGFISRNGKENCKIH
jgi:translation elongation factor EF-1alpha